MQRYRYVFGPVFILLFLISFPHAFGGQRSLAEVAPEDMTVEELRTFQSYFFARGGRDPMVMRLPTSEEIGITDDKKKEDGITLDQQRLVLEAAIDSMTTSIRSQRYQEAIDAGDAVIMKIEQEWPAIKPEHTDIVAMVEEIRSYHRMAITLKRNQEIKDEFLALSLKVNGVVWSPTDAKAVVNGQLYSAGEMMIQVRKQGDLRIEMIEEHGVIFQFKGIRFRLPVEIYAPMSTTGKL